MYKVMAKKDGKTIKIERIEVDAKNILCAVWYKEASGRWRWDFVEDLDAFKIEEA